MFYIHIVIPYLHNVYVPRKSCYVGRKLSYIDTMVNIITFSELVSSTAAAGTESTAAVLLNLAYCH